MGTKSSSNRGIRGGAAKTSSQGKRSRAKRQYDSSTRKAAAEQTQRRVLEAAQRAFARSGIDAVTIAEIAEAAEVSGSSVYALFGSKAGLLRALMTRAIFNANYERVSARLHATTDPCEALRLTAAVARSIYEGEEKEMQVLRGAASFSLELKKLDAEFEARRYELQLGRLQLLFRQSRQRPGLTLERARDVLWMLTSRDAYRMLVVEKKWSPAEYEKWLASLLVRELARGGA
jgi:AcrR family transcriptional regulator